MIQDIEPMKFRNEFCKKSPEDKDYVLFFKNNEVLLFKRHDEYSFPCFGELKGPNLPGYKEAQYLFSIDDKNFFLVLDINIEETEELTMENIQIFRELQPGWLGFAGITGSQLYRWYTSNKFCGRCGKVMDKSLSERAMQCPSCNNIVYPKISPAVIVGIIDGDKLLLTKYANRNNARYALIAGFAEFGETLESTVRREVMEEVGLKVKDIQYYKSQPWSFSDSLLVGYFARLDGSASISLDENELSEAQWIGREELAKPISSISLTSEMIEYFRQGNI